MAVGLAPAAAPRRNVRYSCSSGQLGNGRTVPGVSRLARHTPTAPAQHTRTRPHARASTRTCAPTTHTPTHISMVLHMHDTSTFLHLRTDIWICTSQWRGRARRVPHRARHGRARPKRRHRGPQRGLQPPEQEASRRFTMELQIADKSAAGRRPSSCSARHASIRPQRPSMPGRGARACAAFKA